MYIDFLLEEFEKNAEKEAIIWCEIPYTYMWIKNSTEKFVEYLKANNVEKNSVVAVNADFNPHSTGLLLALVENSNIIVPISPAVVKKEEFIETAQCEYIITLEGEDILLEKTGTYAAHELLRELKNDRHPGLILFSSGSTGKSKAAVHDFLPLLEKFKIKRKALRTVTFLLFDHIGGINTLLHILSNGGTIVTLGDRSPETVCSLIEKYKVELLPTTPTFINMILFSGAFKRHDLSSLKIVSYGTEPMPESTLKAFHNLFPEIDLKQTYGLSEIGIMRSKSKDSASLWMKIGGEDYATKIVDNKLWIKAKTAMRGYLNAPSPFNEEGWFNTGDNVEVDGDYLRILGRDSDLINVGGQKVYPAEVESVLLEMPEIQDAAVFGETNPVMGSIVNAKVTVMGEFDEKALKQKIKLFCKDKLEGFKIPVKIFITTNTQHNSRFKRMRKKEDE